MGVESAWCVFVVLGADGSPWIGVSSDLKARIEHFIAGRGLPRDLRERQPVRLAFHVGPFPTLEHSREGQAYLEALEGERLHRLLVGSTEEERRLVEAFPDFSLRCSFGVDPGALSRTPSETPRVVFSSGSSSSSPPQDPLAVLDLLRDKLGDRKWKILHGRVLERRTLAQIGLEVGLTRERIRQLESRARRTASIVLRRELGAQWVELTGVCNSTLRAAGLVTEESLLEEARRIWARSWSEVERPRLRLLFHLLNNDLGSEEVMGLTVYHRGRKNAVKRVGALLNGQILPAEDFRNLFERERARFLDQVERSHPGQDGEGAGGSSDAGQSRKRGRAAMAKQHRCSHCGEYLEEYARLCGSCGCQVEFLAEIIERELKIRLDIPPGRLQAPGWVFEGSSEFACAGCGFRLFVARKFYTDKNGRPFRYWALICKNCRQVWEPKELPEELRTRIYKSSKCASDPLMALFWGRYREEQGCDATNGRRDGNGDLRSIRDRLAAATRECFELRARMDRLSQTLVQLHEDLG